MASREWSHATQKWGIGASGERDNGIGHNSEKSLAHPDCLHTYIPRCLFFYRPFDALFLLMFRHIPYITEFPFKNKEKAERKGPMSNNEQRKPCIFCAVLVGCIAVTLAYASAMQSNGAMHPLHQPPGKGKSARIINHSRPHQPFLTAVCKDYAKNLM